MIFLPRGPRKISQTNIYHIIMRGINQEFIFEGNANKEKILLTLKEKFIETSVEIYGYCIMDNHIHLLVRSPWNELSLYISRVCISYAMCYNKSRNRFGYVFQNRFKSHPVESEKSFWACLRYIHNNPVKAGIIKNPERYKWSSYHGYLVHNDPILHIKCYTLLSNCFANHDDFKNYSEEPDFTIYPDIKEDYIIIKELAIEHIIASTKELFQLNLMNEFATHQAAKEFVSNELHTKANLTKTEIKKLLTQLGNSLKN